MLSAGLLGKTHVLHRVGDNLCEDSRACHFGKDFGCPGDGVNQDIPFRLKMNCLPLASLIKKRKYYPWGDHPLYIERKIAQGKNLYEPMGCGEWPD